MVSYDTLTAYSIQRFYNALDRGRLITAIGVTRSFGVAFKQNDIVKKVDELMFNFEKKLGVSLVDVVALGLFNKDHVVEFETKGTSTKITGYEIYKSLYNFQMKLQDIFNEALLASMKDSTIEGGTVDFDKITKALAGGVDFEKP